MARKYPSPSHPKTMLRYVREQRHKQFESPEDYLTPAIKEIHDKQTKATFATLRYWRTIRTYYMKRIGATVQELELLILLYNIGAFYPNTIETLLGMNSFSKRTIQHLVDKEFVVAVKIERDPEYGRFKIHDRYSPQTHPYIVVPHVFQQIVNMYEILDGYVIKEDIRGHVLYRQQVGVENEKYRAMIREMAEFVRSKSRSKFTTPPPRRGSV